MTKINQDKIIFVINTLCTVLISFILTGANFYVFLLACGLESTRCDNFSFILIPSWIAVIIAETSVLYLVMRSRFFSVLGTYPLLPIIFFFIAEQMSKLNSYWTTDDPGYLRYIWITDYYKLLLNMTWVFLLSLPILALSILTTYILSYLLKRIKK